MSASFPRREAELAAYLNALLTPRKAPSAAGSDAAESRGLPPGCPPWIDGAFAVLIFQLARLRFCVPVCRIQGAWTLEGKLEIPSCRPPWALGRLTLNRGMVWVADPSVLILPGKASAQGYEWMLLAASGRIALACQGVGEEQTLSPQQVHWCGERVRRPWLLGMVTDFSLPLIDVEKLVAEASHCK